MELVNMSTPGMTEPFRTARDEDMVADLFRPLDQKPIDEVLIHFIPFFWTMELG
jgi:hypothetical protein